MKLATYRNGGAPKVGAVEAEGERVFDLAAAAERAGVDIAPFASMLDLIDTDDAGLDLARSLHDRRGGESDLWSPLASVELLAPVPEPRQMRDGMSFATHIRQSARGAMAIQAMKAGGVEAFNTALAQPLGDLPDIYRQIPIYYITNRQTVVGPGATVRWPRYSAVMDYELEVAAITKRTRANIPAAEGVRHIFGYTIFNDFSARDRQTLEMQADLDPPRAKASTAPTPWAHGSSRRTNSATRKPSRSR